MLKRTTFVQFLLLAAAAGLIYWVLQMLWASDGRQTPPPIPSENEGVNMEYRRYDKNNRLALEIRCRHSDTQGDGTLSMSAPEGKLFLKGKQEPMTFSGKSGLFSKDFQNITLDGNARVSNPTVSLKSPRLTMEHQRRIQTRTPVVFEHPSLNGRARGGMDGQVDTNLFKFFDVRGTITKGTRRDAFEAGVFWIMDSENRVLLQEKVRIHNPRETLTSSWLQLDFSRDAAKEIRLVASLKDSYMTQQTEDGQQKRVAQGEQIVTEFLPGGHPDRTRITGSASLTLSGQGQEDVLRAGVIRLIFDPKSGVLNGINTDGPSQLSARGRDPFDLEGQEVVIGMKGGEASSFQAGPVERFQFGVYQGKGSRVSWKRATGQLLVLGPGAQILQGERRFTAPSFEIYPEKRHLASQGGVRAGLPAGTLPRGSGLADDTQPVWVQSNQMAFSEREGQTQFEKDVHLFQDNRLSWRCDALSLAGPQQPIIGQGNNRISLREPDKTTLMEAGRITWDPGARTLLLHQGTCVLDIQEGNAHTRITGQNLKLGMGEEGFNRLEGQDETGFTRNDMRGSAQTLTWDLARQTVLLSGEAQVEQGQGEMTRGSVIEIDLKTGALTTLASPEQRSATRH